MDEKKTGVEYDSTIERYVAYFDGAIIHRSKTEEGAKKSLDRVTSMQKIQVKEDIKAGVYEMAPEAHDPFAQATNLAEETKIDITSIVASTGIDVTTLVPTKDKTYVPFGNYGDLETIIKSAIFYPTYISGPTGNGKSTMVEQICAKQGRALIRINLNMMVDEDVLIGSKTLRNGSVEIVEGPVLIAMRTGSVLLLDEIDAGAANTLLCLQPVLEGKPYYFKLKNEVIVPTKGFNVIATANTKGKGSDDGRYIGTNVLNEAFLERFAVTLNQEYPSASVESRIIGKMFDAYGIDDDEFATTLGKWADSVRKTFDSGGVDETITTRRLGHVVRAYAVFRNRKKAIELCCNRFDATTKAAFTDLYDKVAPVPLNAKPKAAAAPAPQFGKEQPF